MKLIKNGHELSLEAHTILEASMLVKAFRRVNEVVTVEKKPRRTVKYMKRCDQCNKQCKNLAGLHIHKSLYHKAEEATQNNGTS